MAAVIFKGNSVKALKKILDLNGGAQVISSSIDPLSMGFPIYPTGSIVLYEVTGFLYQRTPSAYVRVAHITDVVTSLRGGGGVQLRGDVSIVPGANVSITQVGQNIIIEAAGSTGPVLNGYVYQETLGFGDGIETSFLLSATPFNGDNIIVYVDGLAQRFGTYTVTGATLDFAIAPAAGTIIQVYFLLGPTVLGKFQNLVGLVDGINDTFTYTGTPITNNSVMVFIDGVQIPKTAYGIGMGSITLMTPPVSGQLLSIWFQTDGDIVTAAQEVLAGDADGVNASFGPQAFVPNEPFSMAVYVNGLIQPADRYMILDKSVLFMTGFEPAAGSSVSSYYFYNPAQPGFQAEYFTLTSTDITNKSINLTFTPKNPTEVLLDVRKVGAYTYLEDFIVTDNTLSWNGLGFEADAIAGTKIRVFYEI